MCLRVWPDAASRLSVDNKLTTFKSLFPEWRWELCWAETCFQDLPASLTSLHSSSLSCLSSADVSSFSSVCLQTFMITDHYPPLLLMNVMTTVWTLTLTPSDAASPGNQPEFKMFNSCERREFWVFDFVCNLDTWWMSHVSCCLILSHYFLVVSYCVSIINYVMMSLCVWSCRSQWARVLWKSWWSPRPAHCALSDQGCDQRTGRMSDVFTLHWPDQSQCVWSGRPHHEICCSEDGAADRGTMKSVLIHRVYTDSRSHVLLQRRWDIIETDRSAESDSCWRSEVRPGRGSDQVHIL